MNLTTSFESQQFQNKYMSIKSRFYAVRDYFLIAPRSDLVSVNFWRSIYGLKIWSSYISCLERLLESVMKCTNFHRKDLTNNSVRFYGREMKYLIFWFIGEVNYVAELKWYVLVLRKWWICICLNFYSLKSDRRVMDLLCEKYSVVPNVFVYGWELSGLKVLSVTLE